MKNLEKVISALELAVAHGLDCMLTANDCAILLNEIEGYSKSEDNDLSFLNMISNMHPYDLGEMLKIEKDHWRRRMIKYQIKLDLEDARQMEEEDV